MADPSPTPTPITTERKWSPEDKRVRCINCHYLEDMGDSTFQCRNEEGPVCFWHFLDGQETRECWCEGFQPDEALGQQDMLPTLAEEHAATVAALAAMTEARDAMEKERDVALRLLNEDGATLLTLRQQLTESQQQAQAMRETALAFIAYYSRDGGCGNCGGKPHTSTCFVSRFEKAIATPTTPERTR